MNTILIVTIVVISVLILIGLSYWFVVKPQTQMRNAILALEKTESELSHDLAQSRQELQQTKSSIDLLHGFSQASQSALMEVQKDTTQSRQELQLARSSIDQLQGFSHASQSALMEVRKDTASLSQAFRSPRQQGSWGEWALEQIAEASGMKEHYHYDTQVPVLEKTNRNGTLKLDMVIHLPNQRSIIIDSKAPSDVYLEISNAPNEKAYADKVQAFARTVRRTVSDLAKKEYWKTYQPSPMLVVMFLPNEAMFRMVIEQDPSLIEEAARQQVMLASPTTLIALLKTIAYGWSQEQRAQSVQHIIQHSQTLYKELKMMRDDWQKHRKQLEDTIKSYNHFTSVYNTKIFPVIKAIQDLDDTLQPSEYLEGLPTLQVTLEEPHVNGMEKG